MNDVLVRSRDKGGRALESFGVHEVGLVLGATHVPAKGVETQPTDEPLRNGRVRVRVRVRVRGSFPSPSEGGKREGYYEKRRWRAHDTYLRAREESHSRPDNARNNNKEDNQGQKNSVEEGERKRKRLSQQRAVSNSHPRPTRG